MQKKGWVSTESTDGELIVFNAKYIAAVVRGHERTALYIVGDGTPFHLGEDFGTVMAKITQAGWSSAEL